VIVDAAHNEASMASLIETLAGLLDRHRPRVLLFAASRDKQLRKMLATARGRFDHVILTRYAINPRAAAIEPLLTACRAAGLPAAEQAESDRLLAIQAEGLADARKRGQLAVESELAALKESDAFMRRYAASQAEAAAEARKLEAAVNAVTDDLDRQAALVRGKLVTALADAGSAYSADDFARQAAIAEQAAADAAATIIVCLKAD
jgi:hypothetical protein